MKKRKDKSRIRFFYINKFDENAMWFAVTIMIGIILIGAIGFLTYEYTTEVFIPGLKQAMR